MCIFFAGLFSGIMWYASFCSVLFFFFGLMHFKLQAISCVVYVYFLTLRCISNFVQFKGDVVRNAQFLMVTELSERNEERYIHIFDSIRILAKLHLRKFNEHHMESWRNKEARERICMCNVYEHRRRENGRAHEKNVRRYILPLAHFYRHCNKRAESFCLIPSFSYTAPYHLFPDSLLFACTVLCEFVCVCVFLLHFLDVHEHIGALFFCLQCSWSPFLQFS